MKKNKISPVILLIFFVGLISCEDKKPSDLTKENIIPKPVSIIATGEYFTILPETEITYQDKWTDLKPVSEYLAEKLRPATGFKLEVKALSQLPPAGIFLEIVGDQIVPEDESYEIHITKALLKLSAKSPAGLIRGIQTVRQILPAQIELQEKQKGPWMIATGKITDKPEYSYRGAMLDVARHFFSVRDVKRFIDLISYYKINTLHLHLTDDQGWRIEIKSWPKLAEYGGTTKVGGGPGGYYTQDQYTEIVNYAKMVYVTIIPEVDMPGHTNAALSAYGELNCDGKARRIYTGKDVGFSTLCTRKKVTYKFVEAVIKELAALTPGPYIHIGGDESHATRKEEYAPFINQVLGIVKAQGKIMIGWDEISQANIKSGSIAQYWANSKNAATAVKKGAKIIMSPARKMYLDMKYDSLTRIGQNWAAYIDIDSSYSWDPATFATGISRENIIGVEAPLWTETITNIEDIEYMVFPRLPGIAEIGWTPAKNREWKEYRERLAGHSEHFKTMGVNYYPSKLIPWPSEKK